MIELQKYEMSVIHPLCKERKDEVILTACAEGKIGRVWVNCKDAPSCAVAAVTDFVFLLGSMADIEAKKITDCLSENCRGKILVMDDFNWGSVIEKNFPDSFKKFSRYAIKSEADVFQKDRLAEFVSAIEPEFHLTRIDKALYSKSLEEAWTLDFCSYFSSAEDFLEHGLGYFIIDNGEIISGASSYYYCEGSIEITIETKAEYRRKGLALACASRLILECLEKNIYPRWDAANMGSVALAEKLGYHFDKEYIVYTI